MMNEIFLSKEDLKTFKTFLINKEASEATSEKYLHCAAHLIVYLSGRPLTKELAAKWKEELAQSGLKPATVNTYIAAANSFFVCMGG